MAQISRKLTRKLLFQKLFVLWFSYISDEDFFDYFYFDDKNLEIDKDYFKEMHDIILNNEWVLIMIIERYAPKFKISNMSLLYILPVYIALAEMFYLHEEIPAKVSINEAIELAKNFADDPVKKIVNWILNNVLNDYDNLSKEILDLEINSQFSFFKKNL